MGSVSSDSVFSLDQLLDIPPRPWLPQFFLHPKTLSLEILSRIQQSSLSKGAQENERRLSNVYVFNPPITGHTQHVPGNLWELKHLLTDLTSTHEPDWSPGKALCVHPQAPGLRSHWKQVRNVLFNSLLSFFTPLVNTHTHSKFRKCGKLVKLITLKPHHSSWANFQDLKNRVLKDSYSV